MHDADPPRHPIDADLRPSRTIGENDAPTRRAAVTIETDGGQALPHCFFRHGRHGYSERMWKSGRGAVIDTKTALRKIHCQPGWAVGHDRFGSCEAQSLHDIVHGRPHFQRLATHRTAGNDQTEREPHDRDDDKGFEQCEASLPEPFVCNVSFT